ncbi:MAG TPA: hypothetical protein VEV84_00085 [Pyrinomonadaceae bacterium]|nr:hypothetical protein [Pyrinomonadaceae bacterium]
MKWQSPNTYTCPQGKQLILLFPWIFILFDRVHTILIDIHSTRAYSSFFLLEAWAIFVITMADFEWNFREAFPMLFTQAEKPLPGVLLVNLNGKPLTNGLLSSDSETYTVTLSEDLTDRIVSGELEAEPCYYYVNNFEDSLARIHLFGLEIHRPADRTFNAGLGQSRQKS